MLSSIFNQTTSYLDKEELAHMSIFKGLDESIPLLVIRLVIYMCVYVCMCMCVMIEVKVIITKSNLNAQEKM